MSQNKLEIKEELIAIAHRQAPGDRWLLVNHRDVGIIEGITETLDRYVSISEEYSGQEFRLAPIRDGGILYIIDEYEEVPVTKPVRKFDLYGEHSQ